MAAESIVSAFLTVILKQLISPAIKQLAVAFGNDGKLQKLKRILERIQSVLVDAEERQIADTSIKTWLSDLKDLFYVAEDVLEDFEFEAQRKQRSINKRGKVLSSCSFYKRSINKFSLCRRLNGIIEKIEAIADEIHKFNFLPNKVPQISYGRPQTHSYVDTESVIGREKEKEDIVSILINIDANDRKSIAVLPIVAMGGMGKTTLSQLVYRDSRVEHHFQLLIWVCVSDADFDVARLARLIIEAATKEECKLSNMELLQQLLREKISGKRYLIVLDDVWNENPIQWKGLKTLLDCGGEGSAVVISTRSTAAAKMMATHTIHYLKQLPEEDGWELFRRRAFAEGAEEPESLIKIGKDIVKRCGGAPLAIETLGSMMRHENDEEKWKAVVDNEIWEIQAAKDNILPALRLSYNYLPSHLKQCFAFCAIYSKDFLIWKDRLIELWMAHGYIPSDGNRDLEILGRDIFDELVFRSFFQKEVEYNYMSNIAVKFKMHDLMHDLARSIMGKECLNIANTMKCEEIPSIVRHLMIQSLPEAGRPWNKLILPTIRTIIPTIQPEVMLSDFHFERKLAIKYSSELKSLRVLNSYRMKIVSVMHLRHLRLLDLSYSQITKLPEGICSLYNLQTLRLHSCYNLKMLPENLTDLVNLRHLDTSCCFNLARMPRGMGHLKQLHTLTMYVVSVEAKRGLEQLRDLNLGGTLELCGIDKVRNAIDAKDANLSSKQNLHSITLDWRGVGSLEVFEALKPHDELKILNIYRYEGQQFPKWMNDPQQLQNLVNINLSRCRKCKELPSFGQLPFLEKLYLHDMNEVKHIISKTTWCGGELHTTLFPSLKHLEIRDMGNLEGWWEAEGRNTQVLPDRQFLPCLISLNMWGCKKMTTRLDEWPKLSQLQELYLWDCPSPSLFHWLACSPSIRKVEIGNCYILESLPTPECLTKLQELILSNYDGLVSLPQEMEDLTYLSISNCKGLTSLPEGLIKLSTLLLDECDGFVSLPQGMEDLTYLKILNCKELTSLPEGLRKLSTLNLHRCYGLVSLPEGMKDLTSLSISNCKGLTSLPEGLMKLSSLNLYECDDLVSLPQGMEDLTSLSISNCKGLTSLPDGLIKLSFLDLYGCDDLVSLPEEGMECFTQLKSLTISKCDRLRSLPKALHVQLPSLTQLKIIGHDELIRPFKVGGDYRHLIENIPDRIIKLQKHYQESSTSVEKCDVISRLCSTSKCFFFLQSL